MSDTTQRLFSNILSTGNKFIVTDKTIDSTFGPGTTGIMGYVKGVDRACANVVYTDVIIIKRGKHGKSRLDKNLISIPIFNFENIDSVTVMPNKKQKRYVYIDPEAPTFRTIYEMPNLEYLAWGLSWTCYLHKLFQRAKSFSMWPKKSENVINVMLNMFIHWKQDPQYIMDTVCSIEARESFIKRMRVLETTLIERSLSYMLKVTELEVHAIEYLVKHSNEIKTCNRKALDKTHNIFVKKYANLTLLKNKNKTPLKKELIFPF